MLLKRIKYYTAKLIKDIQTPYAISCIIVATIIFIFSAWIAVFTYEPVGISSSLYNPYSIFLIIFVPCTSIIISLMNMVKLIIDVIVKKPGSQFRFFMTLIFMVMVLILSFIITFVSISIIKNNMKIWLTKDIDIGLQSIVESFEEKLMLKKSSMSESIAKIEEKNILLNAVDGRYRKTTLSDMLIRRGVTNFCIIADDDGSNYYLYQYGREPVINTDIIIETNRNSIYINSEYEGSFYITAVIPIKDGNQIKAVGMWTEEMEKDFVARRNNSLNVLRLYRSMSLFYEDFSIILNLLYLFITGIACFITMISVSFVSRIVTEPIISVANMAEAITASNFDVHLDTHGAGEIRMLIHRFNIMARSLKYHRDIEEESEKLNVWRDVALKLAHEIKNPLTPITMNAEFIKYLTDKNDSKDKGKIYEAVSIILKNADSIQTLVKNFSNFSFETKLSAEKLSINEAVKDVVSSFMCNDKIKFHTIYAKDDLEMRMDKQKFLIAVTNIIKNAVEAIEPKGKGDIYVSTYHEKHGEKYVFKISIADTGIGIKNDYLESIFEPYYTSKTKGTGLGLSVVEKIITDHGGRIKIESIENEGTTFFMEFDIE